MRKSALYVVRAGMVALALSGCAPSADGAAAGTDPESFLTFRDGLLTYEQEVNADGSYMSNTALLSGALSFERGCLLVGGEPHAFPADGTSWDGTTLTIKGNEFVVGDELVGGGGGAPDGTMLPDEALDKCGGSLLFIVSGVDPKD